MLIITNIRTLTDARFAAGIGADIIGLSPDVSPKDAMEFTPWLHGSSIAVGIADQSSNIEYLNFDLFITSGSADLPANQQLVIDTAFEGAAGYLVSTFQPEISPSLQWVNLSSNTSHEGHHWIEMPTEPDSDFYDWAIDAAERIATSPA